MGKSRTRASRRKFLTRSIAIGGTLIIGTGIIVQALSSLTSNKNYAHSYPPSVVPQLQPLFDLKGHSAPVNDVAWSPNGKLLASASDDSTVHVWDVEAQRILQTYRGFTTKVRSVSWSPDGRYIAAGANKVYSALGANGPSTKHEAISELQVWEPTTGNTIYLHQENSNAAINTVAWSPRGTLLAVGYMDSTIHVLQITDDGHTQLLSMHKGHAPISFDCTSMLSWSSDGSSIASIDTPTLVRVWDPLRDQFIYAHEYVDSISTIMWSPDGPQIAAISVTGSIEMWDTTDDDPPRVYETGNLGTAQAGVGSIAWSPTATYIVGAGHNIMYAWIAVKMPPDPFYQINNPDSTTLALAWSSQPGQPLIAAANLQGIVRIWQAPD